MNREQIIQMARDAGSTQVGICTTSGGGVEPEGVPFFACHPAIIEAFAAAIRSATKEEDAQICEHIAARDDCGLDEEYALDLAAGVIRASK